MILRKCRKENLLIPNIAKHGGDDGAGYEGATVIEPKKVRLKSFPIVSKIVFECFPLNYGLGIQ